MGLRGVVALRWREGAADGTPEPYPGPSRWWGQLLGAAATVQAPLAAADLAGLENSCETKAHTSPAAVGCWRLLLVCLCSRSSALRWIWSRGQT